MNLAQGQLIDGCLYIGDWRFLSTRGIPWLDWNDRR